MTRLFAVVCSWEPHGEAKGRTSEAVIVEAKSSDHAYQMAFAGRPDLPLGSRPDLRARCSIHPATNLAAPSAQCDRELDLSSSQSEHGSSPQLALSE